MVGRCDGVRRTQIEGTDNECQMRESLWKVPKLAVFRGVVLF